MPARHADGQRGLFGRCAHLSIKQLGQRLDSPLRRGKDRNALEVHQLPFVPFDIRSPQEDDQFIGSGRHHLRSPFHRITEDHAQGVVVLAGCLNHVAEHPRGRIAGEIDGISLDGMGRNEGGDRLDSPLRQGGHVQTLQLSLICCQDAGSAGSGDKENAVASRRPQVGEGLGKIVELLDGVRAADVVLSEQRIVDGIGAGQGLGVGLGCHLALGCAPRLENHQRLLESLHHFQERLGTLDALDVRRDDLGGRIAVEIGDQVRLVHISPVAHADEAGCSQLLLRQPVHHRSAHRAALGDDRNLALACEQGPGSTQGMMRVVDPLAIRPDDPHAVLLRHLDDLLLE